MAKNGWQSFSKMVDDDTSITLIPWSYSASNTGRNHSKKQPPWSHSCPWRFFFDISQSKVIKKNQDETHDTENTVRETKFKYQDIATLHKRAFRTAAWLSCPHLYTILCLQYSISFTQLYHWPALLTVFQITFTTFGQNQLLQVNDQLCN